MTSLSAGCFGKLPFHGDFIRLQADQVAVDAIERWFTAGKLDPHQRDGRCEAFSAAGPAFALQQGGSSWWAIALVASHDQVGRHYPFAVFTQIPISEAGTEAGLIPSLFIGFFQKVMAQAQAGWPQSLSKCREMLGNLACQVDVPAEEGRLLNALDLTSNQELWTGLLGAFDDARRTRVFSDLVRIANGTAGGHGLRIQPMVHQIHFCFWLMLLWLLRDKPGVPALLALLPESGGRPPSATVLFDRPSTAQVFATLWPGCAQPEAAAGIHDLVTGLGLPSVVQLPAELEDGDLSLRDCLHALASAGREHRHSRPKR